MRRILPVRITTFAFMMSALVPALSADGPVSTAAPVVATRRCPAVWRGTFLSQDGKTAAFSLTESATGRGYWLEVGESGGSITVTAYDPKTKILSLRATGHDYRIQLANEVADGEPDPSIIPQFAGKSQVKVSGLEKLSLLTRARRRAVLRRLADLVAGFDAGIKSDGEEFEKQLADPANRTAEYPLERGSTADPATYSLDLSIDMSEAPGASVSVRLDHWEDTGGAHGNSVYETMNFLGDSETPAKPADLFDGKPDALPLLSALSDKALAQSGYKVADDSRSGLSPKLENFSNIMLTPTGIRVWFGEYQVGPYSDGAQSADIPASALTGVLSENVLRLWQKPVSPAK